ncbi:hypothetical protein PAL_GLEAN10013318 [Pteropus alecto]|uniref:Uncharacterized protein n=1 Tax=Pteropus alecto TaxID=9402 RepID=L5KF95_PTEAL|nr:hypothetical protein PAL_GLEAN10013318 [Pteropus alecto]
MEVAHVSMRWVQSGRHCKFRARDLCRRRHPTVWGLALRVPTPSGLHKRACSPSHSSASLARIGTGRGCGPDLSTQLSPEELHRNEHQLQNL